MFFCLFFCLFFYSYLYSCSVSSLCLLHYSKSYSVSSPVSPTISLPLFLSFTFFLASSLILPPSFLLTLLTILVDKSYLLL